MKMAKLEIKLILAIFLTRYEFNLVDKDGKFPDPLPVPDRNGIHQVRVESGIKYSVWMLIVSLCPSSFCLDSPSGSHVLFRLREGRAVDGRPLNCVEFVFYLRICPESLYKCRW